MPEWKQYKRKGVSEIRPYILGEDLTMISVSDTDFPPSDMGMIARNPKNHADQWYVAREYFEENLEPSAPIYPWHPTESDLMPSDCDRFVAHIKNHLKDGEYVICTICGKSIQEIVGP